MKTQFPTTLILAAAALGALAPATRAQTVETQPLSEVPRQAPIERPADQVPVVELAICLDTSGSMDGLIEAAKQRLWSVVNDLALAKPTPRLRVALLTFGNDGHVAENGWVHINTPFTEDLDKVSQQLFALTTNGGTELVARVMKVSLEQLRWTPGDHNLKLMIVAGNESADQDQLFQAPEIAARVINKGILVNTIYCGGEGDAEAPGWAAVARRADGHFATIDHGQVLQDPPTPFDDELTSLSTALNGTYVFYGREGKRAQSNQQRQDQNAQQSGKPVAAQRAMTKGGKLYFNGAWDLVDASKEEGFDLAKMSDEDLPEEMHALDLEQKKSFLKAKTEERDTLQKKVGELGGQRTLWLEDERKKQAVDDSRTFDRVVRDAIRTQAEGKGLKFEADQKEEAPVKQTPSVIRWMASLLRADLWLVSIQDC